MVIRFPAYRTFSSARIAANDSMMALLIGARLGEHAFRTSAASPKSRLPVVFGLIPGISRLNRTVGDAANLLHDAESHLAYMAIPYVLAVYQVLLTDVIRMLKEDGKDPESPNAGDQTRASWSIPWQRDPATIHLEQLHEYVAERCTSSFDSDELAVFHLLRKIRNRIVHFNGSPGSYVMNDYRQLPSQAQARWDDLAGHPLTVNSSSGKLEMAEGELVVALATTKRLAEQANEMLSKTLSRSFWPQRVVDDYKSLNPKRFGELAQRKRRVMGHARAYYAPLDLSEDELEQALGP